MVLKNAEVTVIDRFKYPLNTAWFGFFRVWRSVLCCRLVGSKETRVVGGWQETNKQTNKEKRKGVYVGRTFGECRSERGRVEGEEEACDFCLFSL